MTTTEIKEKQIEKEEEKPKKRSWRMWYRLVFFLIVLVGLYFLLSYALSLKGVGTIKQSRPTEVAPTALVRTPKEFDGHYVNFSFPAPYTQRLDTVDENGPAVERILLDQEDKPKHSIAVVVQKREVTDVNEDPSYQARMNDPKTYVAEDFSEGDYHGTLFTKQSTVFEVSAFFTYKGYIMSMTTTAVLSDEGLRDDLLAAIRSLHFNR